MREVREKYDVDINFREKSANFVWGLKYQKQEKGSCAPIFSRVMDFNFLLSAGIALSKVVSVVQEKIFGDQNPLVFFLKDLRRLYQDQLKYLGANEDMIKNVNVTRLKEKNTRAWRANKWKLCDPHNERRCW